jgi:hypothetical protein
VVYVAETPPTIIETGEKFTFGKAIKDFSALGKWQGYYQIQLESGTVTFNPDTLEVKYK